MAGRPLGLEMLQLGCADMVDEAAERNEFEARMNTFLRSFDEVARARPHIEADSVDSDAFLKSLSDAGRAWSRLKESGRLASANFGLPSAQDRLKGFFLLNVGKPVSQEELEGVGLISEWARRVRELRVEEGWPITVGPDGGLPKGSYRLESDGADLASADDWRARHDIRKQDTSARDRILALLQYAFPRSATLSELQYVARIQEWQRRIRELVESGWEIASSNDDPSLQPGEYRLESLEKGEARDRKAIKQRQLILERDEFSCTRCGASPQDLPRARLQIHHVHQVRHGGLNEDENLVTVCAPCHAGIHSLDVEAVADELLNPSRDPDHQSE